MFPVGFPEQNRVLKWVTFDANGIILDGEGVLSVVRTSTGDFDVTWKHPFSSVGYCVMSTSDITTTYVLVKTARMVGVKVRNGAGADTDPTYASVLAIGS